jgi:hypothetical protein
MTSSGIEPATFQLVAQCPHLQKTVLFITTTARTSNPTKIILTDHSADLVQVLFPPEHGFINNIFKK